MSSSSSPCAACRFLRQKCTPECVFAPYFPVDQPEKFVAVHRVFGRSNVAKILTELNVTQREDAVRSLVYEADARLKDPVYGCVAPISLLQQRLRQLHLELDSARKELATYIEPQAMAPMLYSPPCMPQQQMGNPSSSSAIRHGMMRMPMMGIPTGPVHGEQLVMRELQQQHLHQQQMFEAQQLTAEAPAREQQEMHKTNYEQQRQQQLDPLRFTSSGSWFERSGTVTAIGLQHADSASMLALGTFDSENPSQVQPQAADHHHQYREQLFLQPQQDESQPHPLSQQQQPQT